MNKTYHYTDIMYMIHRENVRLKEYQHYEFNKLANPAKCQECGIYHSGKVYTDGLRVVCPTCRKRSKAISKHLDKLLNKISDEVKL